MGRKRRYHFESEHKTSKMAKMVAIRKNKEFPRETLDPFVARGKKVYFDEKKRKEWEKW